MKIVIDIPKTVYKACKEKMNTGNGGLWLEAIIAKGTPYEEEKTCDEREQGNCPFYTARGDV